jgi:hypothetical protein
VSRTKGLSRATERPMELALGTSTRRKVTSAALGGYTIGQMFDDL